MGKEIHKIQEVKSQEDLILWVCFTTGEKKLYDMKPLLTEIKAFDVLHNEPQLFSSVRVAQGGYGILWNEEIDLSSDELWHNGSLLTG